MPRYFLSKVQIEGFRGVNNRGNPLELVFHPNKVTSLFGYNGSGKSSVFEAIEFAITGKTRRLSSIPATEKPDTYYVNRFHGGPATIVLEFAADDNSGRVSITVECDKNGRRLIKSSAGVKDAEAFLKSIDCETLLMDYPRFTDFVASSPTDRGRSLTRLLGLGTTGALRAALEALADTRSFNSDYLNPIDKRLETAKGRKNSAVDSAMKSLAEILPANVEPPAFESHKYRTLCLEQLKSHSIILPEVNGKTLDQVDFAKCKELLSATDESALQKKLAVLLARQSEFENCPKPSDLVAEIHRVKSLSEKRKSIEDASKGAGFRDLYASAKRLLESGMWESETCPLCERPWEHPSGLSLAEFLASEMSRFEELERIEAEILPAWKELCKKAEKCAELFCPSVKPLIATLSSASSPDSASIQSLSATLESLDKNRSEAITQLDSEIKNLQAQMSSSLYVVTKLVFAAERLRSALNDFDAAVQEEKAALEERNAALAWQDFIKDALQDYRSAESTLVRDTVDSLMSEIQSIFGMLMGHDVVPRVVRDEKGEKAFLEVEDFFSLRERLNAVPLLSESYRNALCLSIFLAATLRRTYGGRFVVLDDVTSVFDGGPQLRLPQVLSEKVALPSAPNGIQVILLTHDGLLKKEFDMAASRGSPFVSRRLQGQSPCGLLAVDETDAAETRRYIERLLGEGKTREAQRLIRDYFEMRLMEIIREVGIRVPVDFSERADVRMVRNMLEAITKEVDVHEKMGTLVVPKAKTIKIRSIVPQLVGNWCDHYESSSVTLFTPTFLKTVLDDIDDLRRQFMYTCTCGGAPQEKFYASLSRKRSGCGDACL